jgi:hypothetical protein
MRIQNHILITWNYRNFTVLLLLFTVFITTRAYCQKNEPEKIHVHFDKSFYLVGEKMHYKVYFLNQNTVQSKIVHADIIDAGGRIHMEQILEIDQNTTSGSFKIPYDLSEANYLFRCYTQWNLNFGPSNIYYQVIPVYNEFIDNTDLEFVVDTARIGKNSYPLENDITNRIRLKMINSGKIHRGDLVEVEIGLDGEEITGPADLSIAVLQLNAFNHTKKDDQITYEEPGYEIETDIIYKPEDSIQIKGIAYDPETGEILRSRVLSIYNINDATFTRLSSKSGSFEFQVPIFHGAMDFQIINMNPFQPKVPVIEWLPIKNELPPNPIFSPEVIRSNKVKEYIFYARLRNRINEIFYASPDDSIRLQQPPVLPYVPDRTYDMSKYQLIRDLLSFFKEGVTGTSFFKEKGREKIKLFNKDTRKHFMTSPWFVVDGHFIFNDSIVHHIPFNNLSRIDVFNSNTTILKYFEPIMIQGGVVAVYTKDNFLIDYIRGMPNTLRLEGIPETNGEMINESFSSKGKKHETPDFSPLIYWNANIRTDEIGKAIVSFHMNDITGPVIIEVNGIDRDGQLLTGYLTFEVEP